MLCCFGEAAKWLKAHPDKTINDFAGAIDHHYYNEPSWFLTHTDYYDEKNYSRDTDNMTTSTYGGGMNVFLGEYAAQSNTWKAALSEAAYMTGLERNGDIVKMAAYAPLFGNLTALHWSPDLIWFNNNTVTSCTIADDVKYNIKIEVKDRNVKCYLDGLLYVDYTIPETEGSEIYQVVSTDKTEDVIVKLVNVTGADKTFAVDIANAGEISDEADVDVVAGNSETDDNILGKEEVVTLKSDKVSGIKDKFNYTVPKYSVTVLSIKRNGNN